MTAPVFRVGDKAVRVQISSVAKASGGWSDVERVTAVVVVRRANKTIDTYDARGVCVGTWRSAPRGDYAVPRDGYWYGSTFATTGYLREYRGPEDDRAIEIEALRVRRASLLAVAKDRRGEVERHRAREREAAAEAARSERASVAADEDAAKVEAQIAVLEGCEK